ncbi:hypothetical protein NDU88_000799 [Pleurodeles waltl]|uniref:Uncharacterized protein n=1 Tax=Pleurodeles waltl TaxID=8319 RepID=A0AAV7THB0_PLEWA|nr:hypothetical protein NDU88_000799 [Pleurodeles waltl]
MTLYRQSHIYRVGPTDKYPGGTRRSDSRPPNPEVESGDEGLEDVKRRERLEARRREEGGKRRDAQREDRGCQVQRGDAATGERQEDDEDHKGTWSVERNPPVQWSDEVKGEPEKTREFNFPDRVEPTQEKDAITCHILRGTWLRLGRAFLPQLYSYIKNIREGKREGSETTDI